jgi:hypothetical protein
MSNAALSDLDAELHEAFAAEGWADTAVYRATAVAAPFARPIRCMVDRRAQQLGTQQQAGTVEVLVTLIREPGLRFAVGGLIDIAGERFRLSRPTEVDDESAQQWAVVYQGAVPS